MASALRRLSTLRKSALLAANDDDLGPAPAVDVAPVQPASSVRALRRSFPYTLQEQEFRTGASRWEIRSRAPQSTLTSLVNRLETKSPKSPRTTAQLPLAALSVASPNQDLVLDMHGFGRPVARETLWWGDSGLTDIEPVDKDLAELAALFPAAGGVTRKKRTGTVVTKPISSTAPITSVLEPRRATALTIAMRKLKLQPAKLGKLAWALRDMNESFLTPAAVELLLRCQPWPVNAVETSALKARVAQTLELAEPDQLVWFLGTTVPDAKSRLEALTFKTEYDQNLEATVNGSTLVKIACKELMASVLLRRLFRVVVYVVNKINEPAAPLVGLPIESWPKLAVPGPEGVSVLQYVAGYCAKNFPELLETADEVLVMPMAKSYSLELHFGVVADARRGLDALSSYKSLASFVVKSRQKLDVVGANLKASSEAYKACLAFFCVEDQLASHDFFNRLHSLLTQFDQAAQDYAEMQRKTTSKRRASRLFFLPGVAAASASEAADTVGELPGAKSTLPRREQVKINRKSIFGTLRAGKPQQ